MAKRPSPVIPLVVKAIAAASSSSTAGTTIGLARLVLPVVAFAIVVAVADAFAPIPAISSHSRPYVDFGRHRATAGDGGDDRVGVVVVVVVVPTPHFDVDDVERRDDNDDRRRMTMVDGGGGGCCWGGKGYGRTRREVFARLSAAIVTSSSVLPSTIRPYPCIAANVVVDEMPSSSSSLSSSSSSSLSSRSSSSTSEPYVRTSRSPDGKFNYGYTVTPPTNFVASNKPLRTHLDEVNFVDPNGRRGYTIGITIDPVRIDNIRQFGTPSVVAARVVNAELNRDGVYVVTLVRDPNEYVVDGDACYDIEYISEGKRGIKRYVTRVYVKDGILYVLTAQSNEDEYDAMREMEVTDCLRSFRPL
ncbi:hypothetical protein ACHAXA_011254 [Cyclostephanos tholiformis]|uniref:PsbP C-terminal domain-containing protein n=1 Tax=Cyclostephanos tholiformis TaxID=382380 RepID=A0ABD3SPC5_9STRA